VTNAHRSSFGKQVVVVDFAHETRNVSFAMCVQWHVTWASALNQGSEFRRAADRMARAKHSVGQT